jgi:hypothetical protein
MCRLVLREAQAQSRRVREHERRHRLVVGYAATGAAVIIFVHLAGGANGTQGGYVEHPVLRFVGLLVWGTFVGATIGWLVRATPSRAMLPLGLGTIVAAIGFVLGLWFAVNVQGQSVIEGNERVQLLSSLVGAGAGWVIGASVGLTFAINEPKPSRADAWRTRGVALAVLLLGVLAASWEVLGEPSGRRPGYAVGAGIQRAYLVDAALVAVTLLVVAGIRQRRDTEPAIRRGTGALLNGIGGVGRGLGCFVLICGLASAPQARRSSETPSQVRANYRTLSNVGSAASRYMEERGSVPPDLRSLRRFGAHELRGTVIASLEPHEDGVCVVVGTDHEGVAVIPLVSGIVYLPHSHGSLSQEGGIGIIQACNHALR